MLWSGHSIEIHPSRADGQAVLEYALIVAIVSIGVGLAILGFGNYLLDAAREGASALIG